MNRTYDQILDDTTLLLQTSAEDLNFHGHITPDTCFLADLGFESLDVVILSAEIEQFYGQRFPFTAFFEEIGRREVRDITVGEWVSFIHRNLNGAAGKAGNNGR